MGKGDNDIKVLAEINVELQSGTEKMIDKLSQEKDSQEDAIGEFNSTMDNVIEKLSEEKDSPDDFYGFLYDTDNDASISAVYEEVVEMASDQDESLFDQEVVNDSLDSEDVKQGRPIKRIRVTQKETLKDEMAKNG
nr:hypothetical protein [Tanacetum cinerariifolium]